MKTKRKIVQLLLQPETECTYEHIVALCDDGSTWGYSKGEGNKWKKYLPEIPQDGEKT